MKTFEEYMEHAAYLIDNHYVDNQSPEDLAKRIQEIDAAAEDQANLVILESR